jgi:hypothetical protein
MSKKVIVVISMLIIIVIGVVAGVILVQQRQQLSQKASTSTGTATVSISPTSGDYVAGDTIPMQIKFNPNATAISGVAVRLYYDLDSTADIQASNPAPNTELLLSGSWTCPVKQSTQNGNRVTVDISCINTSIGGFTANEDTLLADFTLTINHAPANNTLELIIDPTLSIITKKSDGSDILLTPTSNASFNVYQEAISATTEPTTEPTAKPTAEPTTPPENPQSTTPLGKGLSMASDINEDGTVNLLDYVILFQNFLKTTIINARADVNADGKVNLLDYVKLFEDYGKSQ